MTVWIIEPRDPLIVRDGRPFSVNPGARARTLPFPFPSTIAGGVRTRAGQDDNGRFVAQVDDVKKINVRGPFLVKMTADDQPTFLAPAPTDALLFTISGQEDKADLKLLTPLYMQAGTQMDLPSKEMSPVGLTIPDPRKPKRKPPRFWYWSQFEKWLLKPKEGEVDLAALGISGPTPDRRTHVGIDPDSQTGADGALFMTSGLTFLHTKKPKETLLSAVDRLGLLAKVENIPPPLAIKTGYAPLGGERRMMHWSKGTEPLPTIPKRLIDTIMTATGHCRLILLTPACFKAGWQPNWLLNEQDNIKIKLKAAAVGKPQTISGWNFEKGQRGPKPTRRLAPAGSVYYLQLIGAENDIRTWITKMWLQAVSDDLEDRQAGFGIAAFGAWDGKPKEINIKEAQDA